MTQFDRSLRHRKGSDSGIAPADDDGDGGYTLPEILVSLVLMGTIMVAVMAGMFTAIKASTISNDDSDLDAVLGAAADSLGDALFVACPGPGTVGGGANAYLQYVQTGAEAVGWEPESVQIESVEYWDPFANTVEQQWQAESGLAANECDATVWLSSAKTMQKITILARTPDGSDSRTLELVMTDIRPSED